MKKNTKVSICIPVYNGEKTIQQTIDSVLNQTYKNIEVVICDNQSTDNTVEIIKSNTDSRIFFYQNEENVGMAGNWNECLKRATGDYIHFLCADDYILPDCIGKKTKVLDSNPKVIMVSSATDIVNENDKLVMRRIRQRHNVILDGYKLAKKSLHRGNLFGEPSNIMFRKSALEKSGVFSLNSYYTTDWELWVKLAVLGKVAYLKEPLTVYRISTSNTTSSLKMKKILADDAQMMRNLQDYPYINISNWDLLVHKIVLTCRDYARAFYMRIKSK